MHCKMSEKTRPKGKGRWQPGRLLSGVVHVPGPSTPEALENRSRMRTIRTRLKYHTEDIAFWSGRVKINWNACSRSPRLGGNWQNMQKE